MEESRHVALQRTEWKPGMYFNMERDAHSTWSAHVCTAGTRPARPSTYQHRLLVQVDSPKAQQAAHLANSCLPLRAL